MCGCTLSETSRTNSLITDSVTIYHGAEPGLHQSPYTLYVYTVQAIQVLQTGSP